MNSISLKLQEEVRPIYMCILDEGSYFYDVNIGKIYIRSS